MTLNIKVNKGFAVNARRRFTASIALAEDEVVTVEGFLAPGKVEGASDTELERLAIDRVRMLFKLADADLGRELTRRSRPDC